MQPTINNGDILFISTLPVLFNRIKDKDIVVAKGYTNKDHVVCKWVYLDRDQQNTNLVWLEGDNKQNSFDSRNYGFVHKDFI